MGNGGRRQKLPGEGEGADLSLYSYLGNKWFKVGKGINSIKKIKPLATIFSLPYVVNLASKKRYKDWVFYFPKETHRYNAERHPHLKS